MVERPLSELRLLERFGATLTRVRRGEIELLPDDDLPRHGYTTIFPLATVAKIILAQLVLAGS